MKSTCAGRNSESSTVPLSKNAVGTSPALAFGPGAPRSPSCAPSSRQEHLLPVRQGAEGSCSVAFCGGASNPVPHRSGASRRRTAERGQDHSRFGARPASRRPSARRPRRYQSRRVVAEVPIRARPVVLKAKRQSAGRRGVVWKLAAETRLARHAERLGKNTSPSSDAYQKPPALPSVSPTAMRRSIVGLVKRRASPVTLPSTPSRPRRGTLLLHPHREEETSAWARRRPASCWRGLARSSARSAARSDLRREHWRNERSAGLSLSG